MNVAYIRELYDYNQWADLRSLSAAAKLDQEKLSRSMGTSFTSILGTLGHIFGAQWIWLQRWKGSSPATLPAAAFQSVEALSEKWTSLHREQMDFAEKLTPEQLNADLAYTNTRGQHFSYPLWRQMIHVVNHSTYHRGQITTLLRQLGEQPVSTDLIVYWAEKVKNPS